MNPQLLLLIKAAVTWKVAVSIFLAVIMYFAPNWVDIDIKKLESLLNIPIIELEVSEVAQTPTSECKVGKLCESTIEPR